jgi:hypothetical protein
MALVEKAKVALATVIAWIGMGCVMGALVVLGWQSYTWLRIGVFPPLALSDLCQRAEFYPSSTWVGVNNIIEWILSCSMVAVGLIAGIPIFIIGMAMDAEVD